MLIYGANGVIHTKFFSLQQVIELTLDLSPPEGTDAQPVFALQFKIVYFRSVIWLQRKVKY